MTPRNLGILVKSVQIDIRKNAVVRIPSSDRGFIIYQSKFGAWRSPAFDDQYGVSRFSSGIHLDILGRFWIKTDLDRRDANRCDTDWR